MLARAFNRLVDSLSRFQRESASKERLSALGRMSTVIAHEVRNPLMIIKASLRSFRRRELSAVDLREAADDIDHEVDRLNRIVGDVLDFARPIDLEAVPDVLRGKLEFASGEEGRESEHLEHLLRRATADTARARLRGVDLTSLADAVSLAPVRTGERVPAAELVAALPTARPVEAVLTEVAKRLDAAGTEEPGPMASAAELALELLFLTRRLAKDAGEDDTVRYG